MTCCKEETNMVEKVLAVCQEVSDTVDFTSKALIDDKKLDSVTLLSLISALMDEFDVDIPYKEVTPENFNSVEAMAALIEEYQ